MNGHNILSRNVNFSYLLFRAFNGMIFSQVLSHNQWRWRYVITALIVQKMTRVIKTAKPFTYLCAVVYLIDKSWWSCYLLWELSVNICSWDTATPNIWSPWKYNCTNTYRPWNFFELKPRLTNFIKILVIHGYG